jgi:ferredoxin
MRRLSLTDMVKTPWLLRRGVNFLEANFLFSRIPLVARVHPWTSRSGIRDNNKNGTTGTRWLPVNKNLVTPENTPMPAYLLYRLIDEAPYLTIYHECLCRKAKRCRYYPVDIGCLLLGDSLLNRTQSPPGLFHEASAEEAWTLAHRAIRAGLVPSVGKTRVDDFVHGIGPRDRLLAICFCCDCCCVTRYERFVPRKSLEPIFPWLEGITIEVTDDCIGCGICANHCYMKAIKIMGNRAVRNESCRACGRCVDSCPYEAIRISETDPGFLEKSYRHIRGLP